MSAPLASGSRPLRIAVLLSGEGTSLESLCERIDAGELRGEVVVVVASREDAGGLARARRRGIPALAVSRKRHRDVGAFNDALHAALAGHEIDVVALLGFLSPFETRGRFDGRAINVHPALIPAFCGRGFYGHRVHEAVIESGARWTGATVHFVDAEYDHGPIILQEPVAVLDDDTPETLAARVQAVERRLVPEALRLFAAGRLRIEGRRVRIARDAPGPRGA
jgi:formyltetrahydrofolate-dependent phosphoribosylglycinamide formyltransferase